MNFLRKNILMTFFFLIVAACFLIHSEKTTQFAYIGLETWYENMIISLFPFMVLMNLLIQTGFSRLFIRPFSLILQPIFRNTENAIFVIFFGFLCGFPLGAKCAVDLFKKGQLSKENTEYLLCFCNNIGPAYMLGFFVGRIHPQTALFTSVFCFYGIPLIYGIILRYTLYKNILDTEYSIHRNKSLAVKYKNIFDSCLPEKNILTALPEAINGALVQIATLGGYMVIFNALRILPHIMLSKHPAVYIATQSLLEISGGLLCIKTSLPEGVFRTICLYAVFSFNGLCCHFQTFALMTNTPFSKQKYMLHKMILCSITVLFIYCAVL